MNLSKFEKEILGIMFSKAVNDPQFFAEYDGVVTLGELNEINEKVMR